MSSLISIINRINFNGKPLSIGQIEKNLYENGVNISIPIQEIDQETIKKLEPSIANFNFQVFELLRYLTINNKDIEFVQAWSEKLLRTCEVNSHQLIKRAVKEWNNQAIAVKNLLAIADFFIEYYYFFGDLRFLNITLKMAEEKNLFSQRKSNLLSLYSNRIIILTECALKNLEDSI